MADFMDLPDFSKLAPVLEDVFGPRLGRAIYIFIVVVSLVAFVGASAWGLKSAWQAVFPVRADSGKIAKPPAPPPPANEIKGKCIITGGHHNQNRC